MVPERRERILSLVKEGARAKSKKKSIWPAVGAAALGTGAGGVLGHLFGKAFLKNTKLSPGFLAAPITGIVAGLMAKTRQKEIDRAISGGRK